MNVNNNFVNLANGCDFKLHCVRTSKQAFQAALDQNHHPSRCHLFFIFISEGIHTPVYLIYKVADIAMYIFSCIFLESTQRKRSLFNASNLSDFLGFLAVQVLIPLTCTIIRISATFSGIFFPRMALHGWKLAEVGEELSYQIWARHEQEWIKENEGFQVYEEIAPANALIYLGNENCKDLMRGEINEEQLEQRISQDLSAILRNILAKNGDCFHHLLDYKDPIQTKQLEKPWNNYFISHQTKQILRTIQNYYEPSPDKSLEEWLIDSINALNVNEQQKIFTHICLNLEIALLKDNLNFNQNELENQMTPLKDLFSLRLRFGRAHFFQTTNPTTVYSLV